MFYEQTSQYKAMLLEFTVGNYLSFKDKKTLCLEASPITEFPENLFEAGAYNVLRSVVLYGANSSGKSNLIKALIQMKSIVAESGKTTSTDKIEVSPFLLSTATENEPSFFEVLFMIGEVRYRYGFEVDDKIVHAEWLYSCKGKNEKELFTRIKDELDVSSAFSEGKGLELRTRENALFLSIVDQFNGDISKKIMEWFNGQTIVSGLKHETNRGLTLAFLKDPNFRDRLNHFIDSFNLGFNSISLADDDKSVVTYHNKYNESDELVDLTEFSLIINESSGTNKLFDMAGYIWVGLFLGRLVIIDELDAKLHPIITQAIVSLFNSPESNPKNAQLIFATHDTNLLNHGGFRRDQIYFTEKDQFEATDLYSLVDYKDVDDKKVRKDRSFEKDYIEGRYGAIPFVGDFKKLFSNG